MSFPVTKTFDAGFNLISPIQPLSNGSLVFREKKHIFKQYNLHTGAEMNCVDVPESCSLSPVKLQGRFSVAVGFGQETNNVSIIRFLLHSVSMTRHIV